MPVSVAILDNEIDYLKLMKLVLDEHFTMQATHDTNEFLRFLKQPAVIVVDWNLGSGVNGLQVVKKAREKNPLVFPIFISSMVTKEMLLEISEEGWAFFALPKDKSDFFTGLITKIKRAKEQLLATITEANEEAKRNELLKEKITDTLKKLEEKSDGKSY